MPTIETFNPLDAAVDLAAGYFTQKRQNANDAVDRDLQRKVVDSQLQEAAQRSRLTQAQIDAAQGDSEQAARDRTLESGLKLPKGWSKMTPDQKISYLQVRMNLAQAAGDKDLVDQTQAQINALALDAQRTASAAYTSGARTELTEAQATNAKGLFQQQLRLLDRKGALQMSALYTRFKNQALHGGAGEADAENRAAIAAMNAMERTEYGEQIRGALDQYNQAQSDYRRSFDPTTNTFTQPAPQTFVLPQAPPVIIMTPNGPQAVSIPGQQAQRPPISHGTSPTAAHAQSTGWQGFGGKSPDSVGGGATKTGRTATKPGSPTLYEYSDGSWRPQ
jgi:hypothetical protein